METYSGEEKQVPERQAAEAALVAAGFSERVDVRNFRHLPDAGQIVVYTPDLERKELASEVIRPEDTPEDMAQRILAQVQAHFDQVDAQ